MRPRILRSWAVLFCLLALVAGCKRTRRSVEHADVSGRVLYQGKPVPGGTVTFITTEGGFASTGIIDEKGNYTINAPVGDVKISVDNEALNPRTGAGSHPAARSGAGGGPGASVPDATPPTPLKGRYIPLPPKCSSPETSGLTYTVKQGAQTFDINVTD